MPGTLHPPSTPASNSVSHNPLLPLAFLRASPPLPALPSYEKHIIEPLYRKDSLQRSFILVQSGQVCRSELIRRSASIGLQWVDDLGIEQILAIDAYCASRLSNTSLTVLRLQLDAQAEVGNRLEPLNLRLGGHYFDSERQVLHLAFAIEEESEQHWWDAFPVVRHSTVEQNHKAATHTVLHRWTCTWVCGCLEIEAKPMESIPSHSSFSPPRQRRLVIAPAVWRGVA